MLFVVSVVLCCVVLYIVCWVRLVCLMCVVFCWFHSVGCCWASILGVSGIRVSGFRLSMVESLYCNGTFYKLSSSWCDYVMSGGLGIVAILQVLL